MLTGQGDVDGTCSAVGQDDIARTATYDCRVTRNASFTIGFEKYDTCQLSQGSLKVYNVRIQAFQCPATDIGGISLQPSYATAVVNGICQTGERASDQGPPKYHCQDGVGWTLDSGSCVPSNSNPSNSNTQGSSSNSNTGVVVGSVLGALLLLILAAALIYRRKQRQVPANFFQENKGGLVENFTMNLHYKDIQKQFTRQGDYEVSNTCCAV